ncbi:MAG: hypothetical protein M3Y64_06855, partial [Gemmatimonadota bacterium]|nr:hypothetical protein [Gemmatimonadota bacterium]
ANITVTATSAANGTFAASTITQVVPVVVSPLANVSIQAINQGPTVTTGLDSVYSGLNAVNTTAPGSGAVGPQTGAIAGIRRALNPQIGQPIDVTNTKDQIQVILNLQSNGQRVDSVVVYVDPATTQGRRGAARQIFSNGDAGLNQTVSIETFILTDDFTTNDVSGVGEVHFQNGLKAISASVWTTLSTGQTCPIAVTANNTCELQNAANVRQNVNFNNIDGFAVKLTNPANAQQDVSGRTWYGGPNVSDIGQPSGLGSFQVYPVIYTVGRTIQQVSATFGNCLGFNFATGLPNSATDPTAPFIFQFGKTAPATPIASAVFINCGPATAAAVNTPGAGTVGAYDVGDQFRFEDFPMVVASLDNSFNPGPRTLYAYNPTLGPEQMNNGVTVPASLTGGFAGPRPTLFRTSPQLVAQNPIRIDYQNPALTLAVSQTNGERFVNDAYRFSTGTTANDLITNGTGVGLCGGANSPASCLVRNTAFEVASANPNCGLQTFQPVSGGSTATIGGVFQMTPLVTGVGPRESTCDFTNNAYVARVSETDRLGNRAQFGSLANGSVAAFPLFGIDNTPPVVQDAWDGSGPIPDMPNHYLATRDSIFQPVNGFVAATPIAIAPAANATDFLFGVRYTDTRSGFNITNHGTRLVRRFRPGSPSLSNRAVIDTVSSRIMSFVGNNGNPDEVESGGTYRRDSVSIYGAGPLANNTAGGTPYTANPQVGYYLYTV